MSQLSEPVKSSLFAQLLVVLKAYEFIDFILSFLQESVTNFPSALATTLSLTTAATLAQIREADIAMALQGTVGNKLTLAQRDTIEYLVKRF